MVVAATAGLAGWVLSGSLRTVRVDVGAVPLRPAATAAAACAAMAGLTWLLVRDVGAVDRMDAGIARWGRAHAGAGSDRLLHAVTDLGSTLGVTAAALAVGLVALHRTRNLWVVPFLAAAPLGDSGLNTLVKDLTHRPRPTVSGEAIGLGWAFPSGHSGTAAAAYAAMALVLLPGVSRPVRRLLVATAVAVPVGVATTRVLLGVHWFTDTVAGLTLGWAWCAVCVMVFARVLPGAR